MIAGLCGVYQRWNRVGIFDPSPDLIMILHIIILTYTCNVKRYNWECITAYSTLAIWCRIFQSCIFHPCYLVPHFPVLHIPPLQFGAAFSSPAYSTPAIRCRIFQSCIFHPCIFDGPAFSSPAFSVGPTGVPRWQP